jgi:hypothetical protein
MNLKILRIARGGARFATSNTNSSGTNKGEIGGMILAPVGAGNELVPDEGRFEN